MRLLIIEIFSHLINCSESMGYFVFDLFIKLCVCFLVSLRLKDGVPSKVSASSRLDDWSWSFTDKKHRLFELWAHICDNALCVSCFIWEWLNHFCKTLWSYIFQKPFNIWSWKSFICIKAQRSILNKYCFLSLFKCNISFLFSNFFWITLKFRY